MNVVMEPGLADRAQQVVLEHRQMGGVPPGEAERAFAVRADADRPAQADRYEIAAADTRRQPKNLLLVSSVRMEKNNERIGIARLIAKRRERADGQRPRCGD